MSQLEKLLQTYFGATRHVGSGNVQNWMPTVPSSRSMSASIPVEESPYLYFSWSRASWYRQTGYQKMKMKSKNHLQQRKNFRRSHWSTVESLHTFCRNNSSARFHHSIIWRSVSIFACNASLIWKTIAHSTWHYSVETIDNRSISHQYSTCQLFTKVISFLLHVSPSLPSRKILRRSSDSNIPLSARESVPSWTALPLTMMPSFY